MKKVFTFVFIILSLSFCAQIIVTDTAQIVIPNRRNTLEAKTKPYVIMISADGFRYDYAKKYNAQNLLKFSNEGVQAKAMMPAFPSVTGPNHYTLITGMYPSHTGFVDNFFYDAKRNDYFSMGKKEKITDGSWLGGKPLWSLAEEQGLLSASLFWVASNGTAGGTRPTYYYDYHEQFDSDQRINTVVNWLKLPEDQRPHFISMYFFEVDKTGHLYGSESKETADAVQLVDDAVGKLVKRIEALNLPNVNFVFVSDHGMMDVDTANPIKIPEMLFDNKRFDFVSGQTLLRILVKNENEVNKVYKELQKSKTKDYEVYMTKNFPRRLHYRSSDDFFGRIGQILLVPKAPKIFLRPNERTKLGKHGYDPQLVPEMKAVFYAWGSEFNNHMIINEFSNVNVYPLISKILGLKINHKIDGKLNVLKPILKKKK